MDHRKTTWSEGRGLIELNLSNDRASESRLQTKDVDARAQPRKRTLLTKDPTGLQGDRGNDGRQQARAAPDSVVQSSTRLHHSQRHHRLEPIKGNPWRCYNNERLKVIVGCEGVLATSQDERRGLVVVRSYSEDREAKLNQLLQFHQLGPTQKYDHFHAINAVFSWDLELYIVSPHCKSCVEHICLSPIIPTEAHIACVAHQVCVLAQIRNLNSGHRHFWRWSSWNRMVWYTAQSVPRRSCSKRRVY